MKLRVARHTANLIPITQFYTEILGMEILGQFKDHDGYDGVFLGDRNADWHLEFTTSAIKPHYQFDEDDLLVFYPVSIDEYDAIAQRIVANNIAQQEPQNPYWKQNGIMILDPDGFGIILAKV